MGSEIAALHLDIVNHLEPQGVKLLYELFNFSYFFYWDCNFYFELCAQFSTKKH